MIDDIHDRKGARLIRDDGEIFDIEPIELPIEQENEVVTALGTATVGQNFRLALPSKVINMVVTSVEKVPPKT